jgi:hypothetical protein
MLRSRHPGRDPKAKSLGAVIMRDVMEVMDAGWLSIFRDPTGANAGPLAAEAKITHRRGCGHGRSAPDPVLLPDRRAAC